MILRICSLLLIFFLSTTLNTKLFCQVFTYKTASKFNYIVKSKENDSITDRINQAAYDYSYFDELRYFDSRRTLKVYGYDASITLLSAKELLDKYGKQISPLTTSKEIDSVIIEMHFDEVKHPAFKRFKLN